MAINPTITIENLIPVGEAMPERNEKVIVYVESTNDCHVGYWAHEDSYNKWFNSSGFRLHDSVTHWMPLPFMLRARLKSI